MISAELLSNWRDRLPDPGLYYGQHIENLTIPDETGWAHGVCPFHTDRDTTLFVCLAGAHSGSWRCGASCGGGDMLEFQMRLYNQSFASAAFYLISFEHAMGVVQ